MGIFHQRTVIGHFDREKQRVLISRSVCTGEKSLCFIDRDDGSRHQVGCIRSESDLQCFMDMYHFGKTDIEEEF